ncbi:hypothetical protein JZ751_001736 [Albula glossodonta]|uniref:Fibronectin type-III domain-containing protein n=1 Tax=Albula glossodonta TaxID=121402 RepID=A0A8T2PUK9_9TELE|nr:hypothetical protein JZ751_001736 [Albula glossodonta]
MDVVCILWLSVFVMITFQGGHHALSEDRESNRHSRQKVTVQSGELKPCKDNDHLCVTDSSDCIPESSVIQGEVKNISCFYQRNDESITCSWNSLNNYNGDIEYTLFFSSVRTMYDCPSIFNLAAVFNVTVRARSNKKTTLALSDPCVLDLCAAERPSRPNITSISSMTKNSLHVKWTTDKFNFNATVQCKIRYKVTTAAQWTQVMDNSIVDQRGVYTIEDLQPFSSYRVAVSCTGGCGQKHWSDWSTERLGSTPETAPSKPLNVCQHIEPLNSEGKRSLWLMWKALDVSDTHGNILGYQVHYVPPNQLSLGRTVNTTDMGIWLSLIDEEYDVRVMAYNGAGGSPYTYCKITNDLQSEYGFLQFYYGMKLGEGHEEF